MTWEPIAIKLIDDHWEYIENLLNAQGCQKDEIGIAKFHYKTAGLHFFKHALEEVAAGHIDAYRALLPKGQLELELEPVISKERTYNDW